jgi:hypothetical protein
MTARELPALHRRPPGDSSAPAPRNITTPASGKINQTKQRREVGPLQTIAPGPLQAIVLNGATRLT